MGGHYLGADDHVSLWVRSLRDLGASVCEYSTDDHRDALDCKGRAYDYGALGPVYLRYEMIRDAIEEFDPHWIFCCAGGLSFTPYDAAALRKRYCVTGMALSDLDAFAATNQHICRNFDVYFTNSREAAEMYAGIGAKVVQFGFPCYPPLHHRVACSAEFSCEVLFVGESRPERVALVHRISSLFRTKVFGTGWDRLGAESGRFLSVEDVVTAINSATVCVDFARDRRDRLMVKLRVFEIAGCGGVVCTEEFDELATYFRFGSEILSYRTNDELVAQIRQCISDPSYRERISENAYRRAHGEHTFAHRWTQLVLACGVSMG